MKKINFSLKLSYHKVYFSATWCKGSLLYDQTIEDINIFSPAFVVELRGWLKLPHSPLHLWSFCEGKKKKNRTRRMPVFTRSSRWLHGDYRMYTVPTRILPDVYGGYTEIAGCIRWLHGDSRIYTVATRSESSIMAREQKRGRGKYEEGEREWGGGGGAE